jgi:hypothetical protein
MHEKPRTATDLATKIVSIIGVVRVAPAQLAQCILAGKIQAWTELGKCMVAVQETRAAVSSKPFFTRLEASLAKKEASLRDLRRQFENRTEETRARQHRDRQIVAELVLKHTGENLPEDRVNWQEKLNEMMTDEVPSTTVASLQLHVC